MRCYQMAPGKGTATVAAGETLGFLALSAVTHFGPVQFYAARVPDSADINTWEAAGNVWFKIGSITAVPPLGSSEATWPAYSTDYPPFFPSHCLPLLPPLFSGLSKRSQNPKLTPKPTRQETSRRRNPQEHAKRQVPDPRRVHRAAPGAVGRRRADLPVVRAGRGDQRRQRHPGTPGRVSGGLQSKRRRFDLVVLPGAHVVHGSGPGCLDWLDWRTKGYLWMS